MNPLADVLRPAIAGTGEQHHRAAELHLIAAGEFFLIDPTVVDERAVGAAQIDDQVLFAHAANFGMAAGDFGIVQLHPIFGIAAKVECSPMGVQFVSDPLIPTLNDKQGSHERAGPRLETQTMPRRGNFACEVTLRF